MRRQPTVNGKPVRADRGKRAEQERTVDRADPVSGVRPVPSVGLVANGADTSADGQGPRDGHDRDVEAAVPSLHPHRERRQSDERNVIRRAEKGDVRVVYACLLLLVVRKSARDGEDQRNGTERRGEVGR